MNKKEDLEQLIKKYSGKKHKRKESHKKLTFVMLMIVVFSLTLFLSIDFTKNELPNIQGFVAAEVTNSASDVTDSVGHAFSSLGDFRNNIRTNDNLIKIKLFFYSIWAVVVLVGSAVYYEMKR